MHQVTDYRIQKESVEDMIKAQRFNPSLEITFKDSKGMHTNKIGSGYCDEISVFRDGDITYVLSMNYGLTYVGMEAFDGSEKVGDVFFQEEQVDKSLCLEELELEAIVSLLREYMEY